MSKKILYECMKCGKTFIEKAIDGLSCCKCKKALRPLGDVDEIKEYIATMQDKLEKADRSYSKIKNNNNTITIKLVLDTTEFNNKLHEVAEELQHIKVLETAIQFDKAEKIFKKIMDAVDNTLLGYRIYTKEDYKRYLLSNSKAHYMKGIIEDFEKRWETISKGYNFIIGVGKEDKSMMVYSVEYFNDNVLGGAKAVEYEFELPKKQVTIQEINKLMTETLTKATQTLSLMTKDIMNRSNNNG
ncbi:hypothetical protein [Clostridium botulinum]|uniref:hypothetical protein n=1 Tax=Clostridium botulinum TaxID=1491 RepID=UPI001E2C06C2|nr:hypothetical protein [Clostridium botulinum]